MRLRAKEGILEVVDKVVDKVATKQVKEKPHLEETQQTTSREGKMK